MVDANQAHKELTNGASYEKTSPYLSEDPTMDLEELNRGRNGQGIEVFVRLESSSFKVLS